MIDSKFAFFQMKVERSFCDPSETDEPSFRVPPKAFDPVHMRSASHKLIFAMGNPEMFAVPHIYQAIIASPPIRIDHAVQGDLSPNNRLQRGLSTIWNEFRVDVPIPLEDPKDNGFAICSSSSFPLNAARSKIRFIDFDLATERRLGFAEFGNTLSKSPNISVDRVTVHPS